MNFLNNYCYIYNTKVSQPGSSRIRVGLDWKKFSFFKSGL